MEFQFPQQDLKDIDAFSILEKLVNRPNPIITLGPIDASCSFLICDASLPELPVLNITLTLKISHVSRTFEETTGYSASEILGKNCRFMQAPGGIVDAGSVRQYSDNNIIFHMKTAILSCQECQFSLVNYRKNCDPFINLMTIIPICYYSDKIVSHYVGLQIDLIEQPDSILERMGDGSYYVNYQRKPAINYILQDSNIHVQKADQEQEIPLFLSRFIDNCGDFVHILSIKGLFLYTSPKSLMELLGFESGELLGKNISEFVHPSDLVFVMRELRSASANDAINIVCRFKRKAGDYVYLELRGHVYQGESGKRTRCIVMTGREKKLGKISVCDILYPDLDESWAKISPEGLFLFNDSSSEKVFGCQTKQMFSKSIFDFIQPDQRARVKRSLQIVCESPPYIDIHDLDLCLDNGSPRVHIRVYNDSESAPRYLYCQTKILIDTRGHSRQISTQTLSEFSSLFRNGNIFDFMERDDSASFYYEINQLKVQNKRLKDQLNSKKNGGHKKERIEKAGSNTSSESSRTQGSIRGTPQDSNFLRHNPYHRQQDVPCLLSGLFE